MTGASDYDILAYPSKDEYMALYGDKCREGIIGTELKDRRRVASEVK